MGKLTGFLDYPRTPAPRRGVAERLWDFHEFVAPLDPEERTRQAGRCMNCGVPFCMSGCPLGNPVPDFNEAVYRGRWREAWEALSQTNDFPEFTGRVCPAPCEAACVLARNGDAVTIEQLEKEVIERAFAEGWVRVRPPPTRSGKQVAVVGSGPAGLAAAARLNAQGHSVIVFERDAQPGGLLRFGIPDFKLDKAILDRRLKLLEAEGIDFRTGVDVGKDPTWQTLLARHDAVVVAIGARRPRELTVPGRELPGVWQAMEYLTAQHRGDPAYSARRHSVVILGGGDTGADCLGTALRQGATSVTQVELLPAPPARRGPGNPWPQWPAVLRTTSSHEEGGARVFGKLTKSIEGHAGRVAALHTVDVRLDGGALVEVPGTEARLEADLVLLAMGFLGPEPRGLVEELGVALDARGNVQVDAGFATSVPRVFAVGDARRGAHLVVGALADGRDAAKAIDRAWRAGPR